MINIFIVNELNELFMQKLYNTNIFRMINIVFKMTNIIFVRNSNIRKAEPIFMEFSMHIG